MSPPPSQESKNPSAWLLGDMPLQEYERKHSIRRKPVKEHLQHLEAQELEGSPLPQSYSNIESAARPPPQQGTQTFPTTRQQPYLQKSCFVIDSSTGMAFYPTSEATAEARPASPPEAIFFELRLPWRSSRHELQPDGESKRNARTELCAGFSGHDENRRWMYQKAGGA